MGYFGRVLYKKSLTRHLFILRWGAVGCALVRLCPVTGRAPWQSGRIATCAWDLSSAAAYAHPHRPRWLDQLGSVQPGRAAARRRRQDGTPMGLTKARRRSNNKRLTT